jgi:Ca2+-transporting ATPase
MNASGDVTPLTPELREELNQTILKMADKALRTIGVAHRDFAAGEIADMEGFEASDSGLVLAAIVGIIDPLRSDVSEAVATCQRAGVMVRMVTGDNIRTARAIARGCGILTEDGESLEGPAFRELTPQVLDEVLPRLQVLARSSPDDKHTLVTRLNGRMLPKTRAEWEAAHPGRDFDKERTLLLPGYIDEWQAKYGKEGAVVGVTGDGTNDAPALKAGDVGLSMGLSGTEVAKEASDIIIMDDRFSSIVKAVLWGRSVYDNIRKFLQFQLTVNVVALVLNFVTAVLDRPVPLNTVMMLWVNVVMDTFGALALGTETPVPELLERRPYRRSASLISLPMFRNIATQSAYQLIILFICVFLGAGMFGVNDGNVCLVTARREATGDLYCQRYDFTHNTFIFNCFVWMQIWNEYNARRLGDQLNMLSGAINNVMFLSITLFTVGVQFLLVEGLGLWAPTAFKTMAMNWQLHLWSMGLGLGSLPVGVLMRFIPVKESPSSFGGYEPKVSGSAVIHVKAA